MRSLAGASAALIEAALDGRTTVLANVALVLEYEAVCVRDEHLMAAGLTLAHAVAFVDGVAALAEPVDSHFVWRPQLKDANDEMVLEAAVIGRADCIVTLNLEDFATAPGRFGILLLKPAQALKRIKE